MTLPKDAAARKRTPLVTGCLDYFPEALAAVARVSLAGNEQHHAGEPLHWDKAKSTDHADSLLRHLIERGTLDADGSPHTAKVAWRALALLQTECEENDLDEAVVLERSDEFRIALNADIDRLRDGLVPPELRDWVMGTDTDRIVPTELADGNIPNSGTTIPDLGTLAAERIAQAEGAGDYGNPITPAFNAPETLHGGFQCSPSNIKKHRVMATRAEFDSACAGDAEPWPDSLGPWPEHAP